MIWTWLWRHKIVAGLLLLVFGAVLFVHGVTTSPTRHDTAHGVDSLGRPATIDNSPRAYWIGGAAVMLVGVTGLGLGWNERRRPTQPGGHVA